MDLERTSPGISTVHGEDGSESKLVRWRIRSESLFGLECERGRNVKASQLWRKKRQPCASFLIFFFSLQLLFFLLYLPVAVGAFLHVTLQLLHTQFGRGLIRQP